MKLKILKVVFKDMDTFFAEIDEAINTGKGLNTRGMNIYTYDSVQHFNNVLNINRIQILKAISQLRPESVYQLAILLDREPQHVLKDCRNLEAHRFIKLEPTDSGRNSLRPVLFFDYDVIKADSAIIPPYMISKKAEKLLFGNRVVI